MCKEMKDFKEIKSKINQLKPFLHETYAVEKIQVFGSFAKNTQSEDSDLDLLVEFSKLPGLKFGRFCNYLESKLGLKVDVLTKKNSNIRLIKKIQEDLIDV